MQLTTSNEWAANRLWTNSLLHFMEEVPGAQLPRKPEVFRENKVHGRIIHGLLTTATIPASIHRFIVIPFPHEKRIAATPMANGH
jgi:hypothetical protein